MSLFGGNRTIHPEQEGAVLSGEKAVLRTGDGKLNLLQSYSMQHNRNINQIRSLGSGDIWYVTAEQSGSLQASKAVGPGGFFEGIKSMAGSCTKVVDVRLSLDGTGQPCAQASEAATLKGCSLTGVSIQASAAGMTLISGFTCMFGDIDV